MPSPIKMRLSVIIPTWKRTEKLKNALNSLLNQRRFPDQVVTVYRDVDPESKLVLESFKNRLPLIMVEVDRPGVIFAENSALKVADGDIICFLDDDAIAPSDWLEKIETFFIQHPEYVGYGGSDLVLSDAAHRKECATVGRLTWYGKIIGNHHQKIIVPQEVEILKGVNMSFRKEALHFLDEKLGSEHHLGNGSHWELDLCLTIRKNGGRLYFDPMLEVKHDSNHDHFIKFENIKNNARNMSYVLLKHLPVWRLVAFFIYAFLWGNSQTFGIVRTIYEMRNNPRDALKSFIATWHGIFLGFKEILIV